MVYISNLADGPAFEVKLSSYLKAFEQHYNCTLPHVYDSTIAGEDIVGGFFPSPQDMLDQTPGLREACKALDAQA